MEQETSKTLFSKKSMSVKLPKNTIGFVANYGRKGFYRVKYDEGILLVLKMLVDEKRIPPIDRWAVQNDLFSLCVSGDEQYEITLISLMHILMKIVTLHLLMLHII